MSRAINFHQPLGGNEMPRFSGPGTMMRLPSHENATGLDACFVGIGMDIGTSHRSGTRFGPRQIRQESAMIRPYNMKMELSPFDHVQVADIGDVPINTFSLSKSVQIIESFYDDINSHNAAPFTLGGDHTIVLPIIRSMKKKFGAVGVIHVDAHADVNEHMFGEQIAHGTPFRRMVEEGLVEPTKVIQIGLRATGYALDDFEWSRKQGFRVVQAEDIWYQSLAPLMREVHAQMQDHPVYISFDIDSFDPAYAPGTGTAEPGGLTSHQGLEIIRGTHGLNIIGGDLVEVSPPYDTTGNTAVLGANILYEMLCAFASQYTDRMHTE